MNINFFLNFGHERRLKKINRVITKMVIIMNLASKLVTNEIRYGITIVNSFELIKAFYLKITITFNNSIIT